MSFFLDRAGCLVLCGLSLVAASSGYLLIIVVASLVEHELSGSQGSGVAHRLSCSAVCGIFSN